MSTESYIRAMPKVDVHIQLEGAIGKDLLLLIAEQTDVASTYKRRRDYDAWVKAFKEPEPARLDEIARETAAWIRHPEDIARVVYELGVQLSKQNIKYAEVSVIPTIYTDTGMSFQRLLDALNDGRNRVERAWKVQMDWILTIPRDNPRKSDEIARWATSAASQKGNVIGLGLMGREDTQPMAQFRKAFSTADKKGMGRVTHFHTVGEDSESFDHVIDVADPQRVTDAWDVLEDGDVLSALVERDLPVVVSPAKEVFLGRLGSVETYPIRELLDSQVNLVLASSMPTYFGGKTLTDVYVDLVEGGDVTVDDVEMLVLNGVRSTFWSADHKQAMLEEFRQEFDKLREVHLAE